MIGFYFHAKLMGQGKVVEFVVHRGSRDGKSTALGSLTFDREEWEAFRPIIVNGMRAAGYLKIPVEFMDQTRRKPVIVH